MSYNSKQPLVLIAGRGKLPVVAARSHKESGGRLLVISLIGDDYPALDEYADEMVSRSPGQIGGILEYVKASGAGQVSFLGKVTKGRIFRGLKLDTLALKLWLKQKNKSDAGLMTTLCNLMEDHEVEVVSQLELLEKHLAREGVLTKRSPNNEELDDARLGFKLALSNARTGIGQSVVVRGGVVVAVEALEGTDACLQRAGELARGKRKLFKGGLVLAKAAGSGHDPRFDVPTLGLDTIRNAKEAGVSCLAVEVGMTIFADGYDEFIAAAETAKIAIIGFSA